MTTWSLCIIIIIVFLLLLSWVFRTIIGWILARRYNLKVTIGCFNALCFKLQNVHITKQEVVIDIGEICFNCHLFNSAVHKLFTVSVKNVTIDYNIVQKRRIYQQNPNRHSVSYWLSTFFQIATLHITDMIIVFSLESGHIKIQFSDINIDGFAVKRVNSVFITVNIMDALLTVTTQGRDVFPGVEIICTVFIKITLVGGPFTFQNFELTCEPKKITLQPNLFGLLLSETSSQFVPDTSECPSMMTYWSSNRALLPRTLTIVLEETCIKYNGIYSTFLCSWKKMGLSWKINSGIDLEALFSCNYYFSNLNVCNSNNNLSISCFNINEEMNDPQTIRIFMTMDSIDGICNDVEIISKIYCLFSDFQTKYNRQRLNVLQGSACDRIGLEHFLSNYNLLFEATISAISAHFKASTDTKTTIFGCEHLKFTCKHAKNITESDYDACNCLHNEETVSIPEWDFKVKLTYLWCGQNELSRRNLDNLHRKHFWDSMSTLRIIIVKITLSKKLIICSILLDGVQLEWPSQIPVIFSLCARHLHTNDSAVNRNVRSCDSVIQRNIKIVMSVKRLYIYLRLHGLPEYIAICQDSCEFQMDENEVTLNGFDIKVSACNRTNHNSCNLHYSNSYKVLLQHLSLQLLQAEKSTHVEAVSIKLNEAIIYWSKDFHVKVYRLFNEITGAIKREWYFNSSKNQSMPAWHWDITGLLSFNLEITECYSARLLIDKLSGFRNSKCFMWRNKCTIVALNNVDIVTLEELTATKSNGNVAVQRERLDTETFELEWNPNTWVIQIRAFKIVFPYEHDYADAVQNEFVTLIRWLKIVHGVKKTSQPALPCDIVLHVREFLFEMSDDPFEVKLRDNYELLLDEYNESMKRQRMLKEKVAELCKTHTNLSDTKMAELFTTLKNKNAEIYIQRSKLILRAAPPRTRLLAWTMSKLELMVLADPSLQTVDKLTKIMCQLDVDSIWPAEGLEFCTLWGRSISVRCSDWKFQLRDFPQPLLDIRQFYLSGIIIGAEQVAPKRAYRTVSVNVGEHLWERCDIERSLQPLKYYHDFNCEIGSYSYAFGPCWEPVIAQCSLSFERIFSPSRDPSPPLPFWDKIRLLIHGRLTMLVQQLTLLLHASLDPYNTTEEMELTWNRLVMDWTNAKFVCKGDLNVFVRTASKYDDCQLLHLPNLKVILDIGWVCLGDPNDHHSVICCAPDKIPEYSSNQVYDSFRAFRSQNINLSIVLETKPATTRSPATSRNHQTSTNFGDKPMLLLYGSTLRWIENLKLILSGVTRPTRRGRIFENTRPRKLQLSRHYKKIHLLLGLHKFHVYYWMSFAMQRGCELFGAKLSSVSEHTLTIVSIEDGLTHRPKAEWSIVYMNAELNDSELWLKSALQDDEIEEMVSLRQPVEKCYCMSVAKVSYGRETVVPNERQEFKRDTPIHRLVVYDLKGAWTKSNRNAAFTLFDTFMRNKRMKKNLSTEALKGFWKDTKNTSTTGSRRTDSVPCSSSLQGLQTVGGSQMDNSTTSSSNNQTHKLQQSSHAASMLQQLIAEAESKSLVYSDDLSKVTRQQHLQGAQACQDDDVQYNNWQISLVNAQVLLKGCETKGYIILSTAKAEIRQKIHFPVWRDRTLVSKTTWSGTLECMQYYATVNERESNIVNENIMWLTIDNIEEKEDTEISEPAEVPNMVGSGVSVGAVVSDTVGPCNSCQLQRIVSRCKCEFFYAGYGDISVDPETIADVPVPPQEEATPWDKKEQAADAFTLMHHDLDMCTNSLQYGMLLDIVNNLVLYVEPHRKEALERLARMRFQLQLQSVEDQRRPIQSQQNLVRTTLSKLRRLEKETYLVGKALAENSDDTELVQELLRLEKLVYECKTHLNSQSEELDMMLSCYKESQLLASSRLAATSRSDKLPTVVRSNEICFKHCQWRLTESDGQIGIADLVLSNFLYTKSSKSDDSVEHLLELGYLRMTNLIPNEIYKEVLCPNEIQHGMPIEYKKVLRVFCREKQPVGGISVKEHFEINLVPLRIGFTKKFYTTMMKFCFPERDTDAYYADRVSVAGDDASTSTDSESKSKKLKSKRGRDSTNFYVHIDDVEKMKERAEKNKLFVYIKVTEVPVRVSYKGNKEKNISDLRDVSLIIPMLEYHNMTWTWLDLLMAIRNDTRRVILSQAIKQKLQFKRNRSVSTDEGAAPQEVEDKARMLFGDKQATEQKSLKKHVSSFKLGK